MKWKDFIEQNKHIDPETEVAVALITREDVRYVADNYHGIDVDDETANEILREANVLDDALDHFYYHATDMLQNKGLVE